MFYSFFPENRAVYEMACEKYGRAGQARNGDTAHKCWIPRAIDTHSECVIII